MIDRYEGTGADRSTSCNVNNMVARTRKSESKPSCIELNQCEGLALVIYLPVCGDRKQLQYLSIEDRLIMQGALIPSMSPEQRTEFINRVKEIDELMENGKEPPIEDIIYVNAVAKFPINEKARELYTKLMLKGIYGVLTYNEKKKLKKALDNYSRYYGEYSQQVIIKIMNRQKTESIIRVLMKRVMKVIGDGHR